MRTSTELLRPFSPSRHARLFAGTVSDSITLVPPTLSDGTFYITVYGTNSYTCRLQNGTPEFTEINFTSTTLNTDTNRVGWRFFKVSDISQQLGALGWDLFVTNFAPGTRIALRRNAAPGIWTFRNPAEGTTGSYDFLSAADFLQRPGHQADVWYVGVFNPTVALGAFTLVARELTAEPLAFDGGGVARVAVPAGKWQYFRVDVPPTTLGWDVRLTDVTAGQPQLVVRRELLPISLANIGLTLPNITVTTWLTGNQWAAGADWTGRSQSADGAVAETGRILTMGYGRPVQAATYYVGVLSPAGSTNVMSYSLLSRGMGPGQAIPVLDLDYAAGDRTNTALAARDVAVYRMIIASNTPSWKVRLEMTSGDALMAVAKDAIPNITAGSSLSVTSPTTAGKRVFKAGHEHFVMLPPAGQTNLIAGTYYLLVAGEGLVNASFPTRIGTGASGCVLHSVGALPPVDLGLLNAADLIYTGALEGGEVAAFRFQNRPFPNTLGFELTLEDTVGNPVMVSRGGRPLADPGAASAGGGVNGETYGNEGGETTLLEASPVVITVSGPLTDETIMLMARGIGGVFPDATYRLRVRKLVPAPLTFDGGISNVVNQTNVYRYFQIDVPPDALGWDVRVRDVLAGAPQLIANLETLPLNITTTGWDPGVDEFWPLGANWIAAKDWTQRSFSADGSVNEDGRILAMGMGLPLEPGRYYVGVRNPVAPLPMSYTLASRGIGAGFTIPVVDVPFAGGSVTNLNVPPREAVYFRVVMPPAAASWKAKVTALNGEAMMTILTNHVPSVLTGRSGKAGKSAQKNGNEHFARLPLSPQTTLPPLTNYVAVVSEGVGTNATRIGASSSSFIFTRDRKSVV